MKAITEFTTFAVSQLCNHSTVTLLPVELSSFFWEALNLWEKKSHHFWLMLRSQGQLKKNLNQMKPLHYCKNCFCCYFCRWERLRPQVFPLQGWTGFHRRPQRSFFRVSFSSDQIWSISQISHFYLLVSKWLCHFYVVLDVCFWSGLIWMKMAASNQNGGHFYFLVCILSR